MTVSYPVFALRLLLWAVATLLAVHVLLNGLSPTLYAAPLLVLALTRLVLSGREVRATALYNARWAGDAELAPLKTRWGQDRSGILLGWSRGQLLALKPGLFRRKELGHVLVCAASRKGKGLHITANLLHWQHSAVVIDIKGDLRRATAGYRAAMGQNIIVLSPSGEGHRYDPFSELRSDEAIRSVVNVILDPEADGSNSAFGRRAASALFAAMKAALLLGQPVLPFVRRVTALGLEGFCRELYRVDSEVVQTGLVDFLGRAPGEYDWHAAGSDKFLQNSWSGMIAKLVNLFSPGILHMTSASDFRAVDLVRKPTTVYLVFKESELEFTGQAFQTVILALINALIRDFDAFPDRPSLPLAWFLDEAGRVTIPKLDDLVSTVAGRGMTALIYVQSLAQLEGPYGKHGARTILDNCHTKLFYTPIDDEMREEVSALTGKLMFGDVRHSSGDQAFDVGSSVGLTARPLLTTDELKRWPDERIVIDTPNLPPICAHRLAHYLVRGGERASRVPPPELPRYDGAPIKASLPGEVSHGQDQETPSRELPHGEVLTAALPLAGLHNLEPPETRGAGPDGGAAVLDCVQHDVEV